MTVAVLLASHGQVEAPWASIVRAATVPVVVGEPIPSSLALERNVSGGEVKITPGKRAYGIRINDVATLAAGMVRPNSRVDIMMVVNDPEQQKQIAKLFMENMRVLAIGPPPERVQDAGLTHAAVASIEVTPEEAEWLAIAASGGSLQLVLRGFGDRGSVNTAGADARAIPPSLRRAKSAPAQSVDRRRKGPRAPSKRVVVPTELPSLAPIVASPLRPVRPDSFAIKVFRGVETAKDSIARARTKRPR